jgi:hypothetical protein
MSISKENDKDTEKWEEEVKLSKVLRKFDNFANRVNGACDAEEDSFDVMVLFTGRGDTLHDVGPRRCGKKTISFSQLYFRTFSWVCLHWSGVQDVSKITIPGFKYKAMCKE